MEPAIQVAIGALSISIFTLIIAIINSVFTAKTYNKSRRLEFLQRRDYFSQSLSHLNDRTIEAQLISARYQIVAVKFAGLSLQREQAEQNTALIASIKVQQEGVESGMKSWDKTIETLQFIYINLTLETDAPEVERMIGVVQVASDNLKKAYTGYSAILHILETANELTRTKLAETDAKIRQINLEADAEKRQINLQADARVRQINLDYERAIEKLR